MRQTDQKVNVCTAKYVETAPPWNKTAAETQAGTTDLGFHTLANCAKAHFHVSRVLSLKKKNKVVKTCSIAMRAYAFLRVRVKVRKGG